MKSNFVLKIKIVVFVSIASVAFSFLYLPNDSRITFSYTTHDRGTILQHGDGLFKFPFQNTRTQPLIISMVKSSCGCLVPYYNKEPVRPNAWDTIYGKYNTSNLGPINKSLTVYSNDSLQPVVVLKIKGTTIAKPLYLKFYDTTDSTEIKINEYNRGEINITARKELTIEIKNETIYDREMKWKITESLKIETTSIKNFQELDEAKTHVTAVLPACQSIFVTVTFLKSKGYSSNELSFELDNSRINIWLRNDEKD